jgi:hypothetical protein
MRPIPALTAAKDRRESTLPSHVAQVITDAVDDRGRIRAQRHSQVGGRDVGDCITLSVQPARFPYVQRVTTERDDNGRTDFAREHQVAFWRSLTS